MDKNQNNKLNMITKVLGVFNENTSIINKYSPIQEQVEFFKSKAEQLHKLGSEQEMDYSGITDTKAEVKETLCLFASDLAHAGIAYAIDQGNQELVAYLDHSYSDLRYSRDNATLEKAMVIHNELEPYADSLADYLVTAEDIAYLQQLIDRFAILSETRAEKDSHGVVVTKQLSLLFKEVNDLLNNKLDALITRLRNQEPMFYQTYMNARQVIDLGGRGRREDEQVA